MRLNPITICTPHFVVFLPSISFKFFVRKRKTSRRPIPLIFFSTGKSRNLVPNLQFDGISARVSTLTVESFNAFQWRPVILSTLTNLQHFCQLIRGLQYTFKV